MSQGDVSLTLNGREVTLACTLGAAIEINGRYGSFMEAQRRVESLDFNAYAFIVAKGLDKPIEAVQGDVFKHGVLKLVRPVSDYVASLARGGQPIDKPGETKTGEG